MNKNALRNASVLIVASLIFACATYIANFWLFSSNQEISSVDALFFEGTTFIILGVLLVLGSGGINRRSRDAALLAATAEAIYGEQIMGPSEIFRRDAWKPRGFMRVGLILILTGTILLLIYFVSTYIAI